MGALWDQEHKVVINEYQAPCDQHWAQAVLLARYVIDPANAICYVDVPPKHLSDDLVLTNAVAKDTAARILVPDDALRYAFGQWAYPDVDLLAQMFLVSLEVIAKRAQDLELRWRAP